MPQHLNRLHERKGLFEIAVDADVYGGGVDDEEGAFVFAVGLSGLLQTPRIAIDKEGLPAALAQIVDEGAQAAADVQDRIVGVKQPLHQRAPHAPFVVALGKREYALFHLVVGVGVYQHSGCSALLDEAKGGPQWSIIRPSPRLFLVHTGAIAGMNSDPNPEPPMTTFKILPKTSIRIADLKDKTKEQVASQYDVGGKGFLTTTEAYRLYANNNNDTLPSSLDQVVNFLGGAQHPIKVHSLDSDEVAALPWSVGDWKGDFNIGGFGAGNVRTGGVYNWQTPDAPRSAGFLIDLNLVDITKVEIDIISATLVVGPTGFVPEAGSAVPEEAVELPLTLMTQEAQTSWTRAGPQQVPERKYLAASVDLVDLQALAGGAGISFYVRLETTSGTKYINKDGQPGQNFDISPGELQAYNGV